MNKIFRIIAIVICLVGLMQNSNKLSNASCGDCTHKWNLWDDFCDEGDCAHTV